MYKKAIYIIVAPMIIFFITTLITKSYYQSLNTLFSIIIICLFLFFNKKYSLFKGSLYYYIVIFIVASVFLGRSINLYKIVPNWDKILHLFSGFISYPLGKEIYKKLGGHNKNKPLTVTFAILFTLSLALLWEVWEFSGDSIFKLNSQNNSLSDTMWDMIMASLGAVIYLISDVL